MHLPEDFLKINTNLSEAEISQADQYFLDSVYGDPELEQKIWSDLHEDFKNVTPQQEYDLQASYFRWYTELTWRRVESLSPEQFANIAIARQSLLALKLSYNVLNAIMWHLETNATSEEEMQNIYQNLRQQFKTSSAIVGKDAKRVQYTMKDFIDLVDKKLFNDDNSITRAQESSHINEILFGLVDLHSEDLLFNPIKVRDQIEDLIGFFLGVDADHIWYVVRAYTHPEEKQQSELTPKNVSIKKIPENPSPEKTVEIPVQRDTLLDNSTESLRNTLEWLKTFESPKLAWDALGQRVKEEVTELDFDSANAIMQLTFFLKQNGYASEPDIVYYDQGSNSFHWNQ